MDGEDAANPGTENAANHNPDSEDEGDRECAICAETKSANEFPQGSVTATCSHPSTSCLDCIQTTIRIDMATKVWTDVRCPECPIALSYLEIQRYADEETFSR